jgi:hypothetical protein
MCPKLKTIILAPRGKYELRYHEMVPNETLSDAEKSCIEVFQKGLQRFLIYWDLNEFGGAQRVDSSRINPELVMMKHKTDPLSMKRRLPLWEVEKGLKELGVKFLPSDAARM